MSRNLQELVIKDAAAEEPYGIDWTDYLAELGTGVEIQSSAWTVTGPDTALVTSNETVLAGLKTKAFLKGGTAGASYTVKNRIITNSTPTVKDSRSFDVYIETPAQ